MVLRQQPNEEWSEADFKLVEAYDIIESEKCPQCGNPIWLCHSENPNLQFEVKVSTCYASIAVEGWQEARQKANRPVKRGENPYAIPYVLQFGEDGMPIKKYDFDSLPTKREYIDSLED